MFKPLDRALQFVDIGVYFQTMDNVGAMTTMKLTRNSYCMLWLAQVNKQLSSASESSVPYSSAPNTEIWDVGERA